MGDIGGRAQIDTGQPQERLFNDAQVSFHWRLRSAVASVNAKIDRHIQDARAFGKIHAQKKNVTPPAMGQVHAYGRPLAKNGEPAVFTSLEQFGPDAQRLILRMAHAKHPLVAAHRTHTATDLVGQSLKRQPMISRRQGAGNGIARALGVLYR